MICLAYTAAVRSNSQFVSLILATQEVPRSRSIANPAWQAAPAEPAEPLAQPWELDDDWSATLPRVLVAVLQRVPSEQRLGTCVGTSDHSVVNVNDPFLHKWPAAVMSHL